MGEAAAGRTGVNRGAGFIVWGFVMGMVGTRTFGRVGNLSWKEKAGQTYKVALQYFLILNIIT